MTRSIPSDAANLDAASVDLPAAAWVWHGLARVGRWLPEELLQALGHRTPVVSPFAPGGLHRAAVEGWQADPPREADDRRLARALKSVAALSHAVDDCEPAVLRAMVAAAGRRPIRHLVLSLSNPALRLADRVAGLPEAPAVVPLVQGDRDLIDHLACTELALGRAGVAVHRLALESLAAGAPGAQEAWRSLRAFLGLASAAALQQRWSQRLRDELEAASAGLSPEWQDRLVREAQWSAGLELPPAAVAPVLRAATGPGRPARLVKLDRLPPVLLEGDPVRVAGVVVPIQAAVEGGKLWLLQAGERRRLNWGQASPGVAARLADSEAAGRARFRPVGVRASLRHPVRLSMGPRPGARAAQVAELSFEPIEREPIEGIYLSRWSIGYQPIPKAACTSIKEMLFRMSVGQPFSAALAEGARHVHNYFTQRHRDVSSAAFRFMVVRDPIKRFLSAYSSRVLRHRELSREKLANLQLDPAVDWSEFPFDPDLETFIEHFEVYRRVPTIAHHCRPISEFCASLEAFDKVYPFEKLREMAADLQRAGDGFMMRHGFSMLFSAWTWDVAPSPAGVKPLVFKAPVVKGPRGMTANEFIVDAPTEVASYAGLRGIGYEPATPNDPEAVLTERTSQGDIRRPIDRNRWEFVAPEQPGGPGRIKLQGGFQPGTIYEVRYEAKDPRVTGAGLAGIRDLLAYFRDNQVEGASLPKNVLMFGYSQSARLIGRMLHDGLNLDEQGRMVFDGALLEVPGAGGSGGFNSRFVQVTRHPSMLEEHEYPSDSFPFTSTPTRDPVTGRVASTLDHAKDKYGRAPKLLIANTSAEYWNRGASLLTTAPDGVGDAAPAANVRVYGLMGAQHYVGRSHTRAPFTACVSTTNYYLPLRALMLALDGWTSKGAPPPASAYPRLEDGTLVSVEAYRKAFPAVPGLSPPEQNLHEPRLDHGARFLSQGIADIVPPTQKMAFETRVPAPDADGNDRGGVRLVEMQAPLGTHTGWNLRAPETGFAWATSRYDGSFVPFARTEAERKAANDPRPSLQARYANRDAFIAATRAAAARQVAARLLLQEDVERTIAERAALYDRILARDPADQSCNYLYSNQ